MKHLRTDPFGTAAIIHPFVSKPLTTVLFTVLYPLPNFFHINWTPSFMNGCAEPNQGTDNCSLAPFFHNKVCTRCFLGKKNVWLVYLFIYVFMPFLKTSSAFFYQQGPWLSSLSSQRQTLVLPMLFEPLPSVCLCEVQPASWFANL